MKILSAPQMRQWDAYTIANEPVSSVNLMERAATACTHWLFNHIGVKHSYFVFCGTGNNGGDGLAIARMLDAAGAPVTVFIIGNETAGSPDFSVNLSRLKSGTGVEIKKFSATASLPELKTGICVDALFGTGLSRPAEGDYKAAIEMLNASGAKIISIDMPSGLFADASSVGQTIINADFTLTFQCPKLAFLMQENAAFMGEVVVLDIGLHPGFLASLPYAPEMIDEAAALQLFRPRNAFAHKGTAGHALLVGGSYGKAGAVLMAARACLHSGAGLTTAFVPASAVTILQSLLPEVMVVADSAEKQLANLPEDLEKYKAIGIGPGLGTATETQNVVANLLRQSSGPLVVDADALNCLALQPEWIQALPANSILTPHPKEFDRLFGEHVNDFSRMKTAVEKAVSLSVIIVLKSHHTLVALPDSRQFFNSSGNAGMAKGGSGDVLTGIITALLAQGYAPDIAARLGVYLHGAAGDYAAAKHSMEAMTPNQLIDELGTVFLRLNKLLDNKEWTVV